ncbi:MAG: hypothetical protein ACRD13_02365 [Terriglobales bacterium]
MTRPDAGAESQLAADLARLWPHRRHESGAFRGFFCRWGRHRWARLNLEALLPERERGRDVGFCRWCSAVRIGGVTYLG